MGSVITISLLVFTVLSLAFEILKIGEVALIVISTLLVTKTLASHEVFKLFSKDLIFLIIFLFPLGEALFKSGFSEFAAHKILRLSKGNLKYAVVLLAVLTMIISAFTTNTGTVLCLLPIAAAIVRQFEEAATQIYLGLAISASIGGTLTLIGTPPNLIVYNFMKDKISFFIFAKWGIPIAIFWLTYLFFSTPNHKVKIENKEIKVNWIVPIIFLLLLVGFLTKAKIGLSYGTLALLAAVSMLILRIINIKEFWASVSWDLVFLIIAMFSLSTAMKKYGIIGKLVAFLTAHFSGMASLFILLLLAFFLANFISHTATTIIIAPIIFNLIKGLNLSHPQNAMLSLAFITSIACATPLGTPPNTIVYNTGKLTFKDFFKVGMLLIAFGLIEIYLLLK